MPPSSRSGSAGGNVALMLHRAADVIILIVSAVFISSWMNDSTSLNASEFHKSQDDLWAVGTGEWETFLGLYRSTIDADATATFVLLNLTRSFTSRHRIDMTDRLHCEGQLADWHRDFGTLMSLIHKFGTLDGGYEWSLSMALTVSVFRTCL